MHVYFTLTNVTLELIFKVSERAFYCVCIDGSRLYYRTGLKMNEYETDAKSDWTVKQANYHIEFHYSDQFAKVHNTLYVKTFWTILKHAIRAR